MFAFKGTSLKRIKSCTLVLAVGAARTGSVGPFGVSVLGAVGNQEFTSIYFEFVMGADGRWATNFCADYTQ
jgi:hypothetical protein